METKRLYRSCKNRILGGVAGGISEYLEIDPLIIRLIFLVLLFSGVGLVAYLLAWILIPNNPNCYENKSGSEEIEEKAEGIAKDLRTDKIVHESPELRILLGTVLLAIGVLILFENIVGPYVWQIFWPAVLIFIGFYLIIKYKE